ncbi:MAG: hypothetical protein R2771_08750 [Saprospiraceae bacterium]
MRKADLVSKISEETNVPKVDVLVTLEHLFTEIKESWLVAKMFILEDLVLLY